MKQHIEDLVRQAVRQLEASGALPAVPALIQVDETKDPQHGDFATNVAMVLAPLVRQKPREIAEKMISALPASNDVQKVEVAGPGFINFFLAPQALRQVVVQILAKKEQYGRCQIGRDKRILVEYVSSNPTGPLHVGHGRHAAYGSVVCRLLAAVGFKPYAEYYINDMGRQMDILTVSVWLRYLELSEGPMAFPASGYRGHYIVEIAHLIEATHGADFQVPRESVFQDLPLDEPHGGDKEAYIDALIAQAKTLLKNHFRTISDVALAHITADIRDDLAAFGVHFDHWFSERQFVASGVADHLLQKLQEEGYAYWLEGALWFRATALGDEKDRVLVRTNGQKTYFAHDLAYHVNKFERGFDLAIDIFGSDHHGYLSRVKAGLQACGIHPERLLYLLGQFVTLYRHGEPVSMSTREGDFVTLRALRHEVGNDAARFFYVMRKYEQHIDFDLDLAKSQSSDNPVYYLQYAYARISSVLRQAIERGMPFDEAQADLTLLTTPQERQLFIILSRYSDTIMKAALHYEPHLLTHYLREVATCFHTYYNAHPFLVDATPLRQARLALVAATRQILRNGFDLLGITAPETM